MKSALYSTINFQVKSLKGLSERIKISFGQFTVSEISDCLYEELMNYFLHLIARIYQCSSEQNHPITVLYPNNINQRSSVPTNYTRNYKKISTKNQFSRLVKNQRTN